MLTALLLFVYLLKPSNAMSQTESEAQFETLIGRYKELQDQHELLKSRFEQLNVPAAPSLPKYDPYTVLGLTALVDMKKDYEDRKAKREAMKAERDLTAQRMQDAEKVLQETEAEIDAMLPEGLREAAANGTSIVANTRIPGVTGLVVVNKKYYPVFGCLNDDDFRKAAVNLVHQLGASPWED
jgi:chromosome segregation ATPase